MKVRTSNPSRRNFLLAIGAGGAATAAAIAARTPGYASVRLTPPIRGTSGYRASEHVSNYYRTAKV